MPPLGSPLSPTQHPAYNFSGLLECNKSVSAPRSISRIDSTLAANKFPDRNTLVADHFTGSKIASRAKVAMVGSGWQLCVSASVQNSVVFGPLEYLNNPCAAFSGFIQSYSAGER